MSFPDKKYNIIYADPAWSYSNFQGKGKSHGDVSSHYKTMSVADIKKLPVSNISAKTRPLTLFVFFIFLSLPLMPIKHTSVDFSVYGEKL